MDHYGIMSVVMTQLTKDSPNKSIELMHAVVELNRFVVAKTFKKADDLLVHGEERTPIEIGVFFAAAAVLVQGTVQL